MPAYRLSPRARKSLEQISAYTGDNHGQQQRRRYLRLLRDRMREVARNPDLGRRRDDMKAGYFSVVAGRHTIYYRTQGSLVEIIDVLHQSMEPEHRLR